MPVPECLALVFWMRPCTRTTKRLLRRRIASISGVVANTVGLGLPESIRRAYRMRLLAEMPNSVAARRWLISPDLRRGKTPERRAMSPSCISSRGRPPLALFTGCIVVRRHACGVPDQRISKALPVLTKHPALVFVNMAHCDLHVVPHRQHPADVPPLPPYGCTGVRAALGTNRSLGPIWGSYYGHQKRPKSLTHNRGGNGIPRKTHMRTVIL